MTPFSEDVGLFFQSDGFAVGLNPAAGGGQVVAILDKPAARSEDVQGRKIRAIVSTTDAERLGLDAVVTVDGDGEELQVVGIRPALEGGGGFSELVLASRGWPVSLDLHNIGSLQPFVGGWIDEEYPGFPYTEEIPPPASHNPLYMTLRGGEPAGRIVLAWSDLQAVIPSSARIIGASLVVWTQGDAGFPWVLQGIIQPILPSLDGLSWSGFRPYSYWSIAGCGDPGVDFQAAALASGTGFSWGDQVIGSGNAFNRWLLSRITGAAVILKPTGSSGELFVFWDPPPRLILYTTSPEAHQ